MIRYTLDRVWKVLTCSMWNIQLKVKMYKNNKKWAKAKMNKQTEKKQHKF